MSLATITFWEENYNSYGVPNTLHSYLVSVFQNPVIGNGDKIVKVVPLTLEAPKLTSERPFIIRNSSKEHAVKEAFNILREIPELKNMISHESYLDSKTDSPQLVSNW